MTSGLTDSDCRAMIADMTPRERRLLRSLPVKAEPAMLRPSQTLRNLGYATETFIEINHYRLEATELGKRLVAMMRRRT